MELTPRITAVDRGWGITYFQPQLSSGGRPVCAIPAGDWRARIDTPDACVFAERPDGGLTVSADAGVHDVTVPNAFSYYPPTFRVFRTSPDPCGITFTGAFAPDGGLRTVLAP